MFFFIFYLHYLFSEVIWGITHMAPEYEVLSEWLMDWYIKLGRLTSKSIALPVIWLLPSIRWLGIHKVDIFQDHTTPSSTSWKTFAEKINWILTTQEYCQKQKTEAAQTKSFSYHHVAQKYYLCNHFNHHLSWILVLALSQSSSMSYGESWKTEQGSLNSLLLPFTQTVNYSHLLDGRFYTESVT